MIKPSRFVEELEAYKITSQDVWSDSADNSLLKLDWNEAPHDLELYRPELKKIIQERGMIAWYPDCLSIELTDALSSFLEIDSNHILTFPGSDVGLETLCRAYLEYGDTVAVVSPTYENFSVFALQTGATLKRIELLPPFLFDLNVLINCLNSDDLPKIIYITSPNNPCGYIVSIDDIRYLCQQYPSILFVVDEAYIEFSDFPSSVVLTKKFENIVVSRTFSKAFGMAGFRLGYLCAPLKIINTINKIRNGKNISMISQRLGLHALRNIDLIKTWIKEVKQSRTQLLEWLSNKNIIHYKSHGNFVLFQCKRSVELCSFLKSHGIYIRDRSSIVKNCARVTVGSNADMYRLIEALESAAQTSCNLI